MKKFLILTLLLGVILLTVSCAAGPNTFKNTHNENGKVAGFWKGLWQGMISVIAFIISWFTDDVNIYEVHNNGFWYNLGFLIGIGAILGSGGLVIRIV